MVKKLKHANHNIPKTTEEKEQIIENAAKAYESYLDALGFDWRNDPNSENTPRRVAKAFVNDLAAGCYTEPPALTAFPNHDGYEGMVCETGIPVKSLCSHHHQNFLGVAHVAYIPSKHGKVVGLSKLNRIVEFYSRRPQIQESLVKQIADAVDLACTENLGVAVVVEATHQCVSCRGIKHEGTRMFTSVLTGEFMKDEKTRAEFYKFIEFSKKS
jgi:GTP cyclohydrolase I